MIQSLTGFGKAVLQLPTKKISVEVKSLNSKQLDLNMRMPSFYREKELVLRTELAKHIKRGKVDFSLYAEVTGDERTYTINKSLVKGYVDQLKEIDSENGLNSQDILSTAVKMPDVVSPERAELDEAEWKQIMKAVHEAVEKFQGFRRDEGAVLEKDFILRVNNIQEGLVNIETYEDERVASVRERLEKNLAELGEQVDKNRFEQELIYYLEKMDITEEKVRLTSHCNYFMEELKGTESNGKKLGFIVQEMGREINTIGSKSYHAGMQKAVVMMKDELEKIKEQILNVL